MHALHFPSTSPPIPCINVSHLEHLVAPPSWRNSTLQQVSFEHQYRTTRYHIPDDPYPNNIYRSVQITNPILWLCPVFWYYLPLGSIHSPQHMQTVFILLRSLNSICPPHNKTQWQLLSPALGDPEISIRGKFTGAHHIFMFHLPAAHRIRKFS